MKHLHNTIKKSMNKALTFGALVVLIFTSNVLNAQTNVFDDIIATSPNHTSLKTALEQEGLDAALRNSPNVTVFAPTNDAFDTLAARLNTDIAGLLARADLSNILLYHVLSTTVMSNSITNGQIAQPLSDSNTIKLSVHESGSVFANQAAVETADVAADNGVVHITDAVLLPFETVADIAIDNGFSSLTAALIEAELLNAVTDPFATLTVFAPTNEAFDSLAARLETDIPGLLALENLQDILLYHVLGEKSMAANLSNGALLTPLSSSNTLKVTLTSNDEAFLNQAQITGTDIEASNGVVHILGDVVLPAKTVADVAIDNGFSTLVSAVVAAELLPALSNPFASFTVFAPTNDAFATLAEDLDLTLQEVLELPNLADILLYHVVGERLESGSLSNGDVNTLLAGETLTINTDNGVMVNNAMVDQADIAADNGIVHVIDGVLQPGMNSLFEANRFNKVSAYPNPCNSMIQIDGVQAGTYQVIGADGSIKLEGAFNNSINTSELASGMYWINIISDNQLYQTTVIRQ